MKTWKLIKIIILIVIPIFFLITTISLNFYIYNQSVIKVENVKFPSPNGNIVNADIYYPRSSNHPYPVIIYLHGLSWSKNSDARFPLDLARKGFVVITLDQEGHGHTSGGLFGRETLGPFFWKNVIGTLDYIYLRPDIFNTSAIGCFGHSLGGWSTLLASVTDSRINASISLAGPSNLTAFDGSSYVTQFRLLNIPYSEDILHNPELMWNHSAVHYLNGTYPTLGVIPQNLLLIYGSNDTLVPHQQGIDVYNAINNSDICKLDIMPGADHSLMNTDLFYTHVKVIQFFQEKLLGIEPDAEISIRNNLVWFRVYIINLISLVLILYLMAISAFFIFKHIQIPIKNNNSIENNKSDYKAHNGKINKLKQLGIITLLLIISYAIISIIWIFIDHLHLLINNLLISLNIAGMILIILSLSWVYYKNRKGFHKNSVKLSIKQEFNIKGFSIGAFLGVLLIGTYFSFCGYFRLFLLYPKSHQLYVYSLLGLIIPIIGIELLFRKVIQDELFKHNKQKKKFATFLIRSVMGVITIISLIPLIQIVSYYYFMTTIFIIFLIGTSLVNIYLYERSKSVLTCVIFEIIFLAFILSNSYYLF
ncbi:MAG: prolyl oligopeptidase family serine peptidase [Candidatus Lokiarchaeota archaeon]|nr:prolyl oligopeptidase family serine peptidase [Candidatus Lokiarchaeota archaeon]